MQYIHVSLVCIACCHLSMLVHRLCSQGTVHLVYACFNVA